MRKGRFTRPFDPAMRELNASLDADRHLLDEDVAASKAHAAELRRLGLIDAGELRELCAGLDRVRAGIADGSLPLDPELEDIHMNVEVLLSRLTPAAAKLHTARSRNDQVVTDFRLWCRNRAAELASLTLDFAAAMLARARETAAWPMPEYTHTQRAQVTTLGHHLAAYAFMALRDVDRLRAAARAAARGALGSGACVGVNYPYDRARVADALGLAPPVESSLDAVSDRDFALDLAHACAVTGLHLSRFGGELVLWSSREFAFAQLPEEFSSGSSIMPQKRNPDAAEILRGKASGLAAEWSALAGLAAGLPLGYSKDLQDDKPPVMRAARTLALLLRVAMGVAAGTTFDRARLLAAALDPGLYAVDLADDLVARGVPFRQAHEAVGRLMRHLADHPDADVRTFTAKQLEAISKDLAALHPAETMDPARSIARHVSAGGPSPASMKALLATAARGIRGRSA